MFKASGDQVTREEYISSRVSSIFKRNDNKGKKGFDKPENKTSLEDFFKAESVGFLFVLQSGNDAIDITEKVPKPEAIKKKAILLIKHKRIAISPENIQTEVSFLEVIKNGLDNISIIGQEALIPVFTNPNNQTGWSDLVSKDLMEKFQGFLSNVYVTLGQMKGKTMLPLPSESLFSNANTSTKDKVHALESAIIMWTKQIKNVLKQEPESAIKPKEYPGPSKEIEFWKLRADNLSFIHQQLMTDKIKKVLKFLDQNKSTYREPFSELQKEVAVKKVEAIENHKFLEMLRDPFDELEKTPFKEITEVFPVIMNGIYLIYTHSKHYNKTTRLVVLIKEICNTIIKRATEHINGGNLKNSIKESESASACQEAFDNLLFTNDVCVRFKQVFYEYRTKAKDEWKSTKNVVFNRLERFSERCQDIMHLVTTIMQFEKLDKIDIGGTKGETLSQSIKIIFEEFKVLKEQFLNSQNDISDIEDKKFDNDFLVFKNKIKDLERRLAAIFTQAFDDLDTIIAKFKLIESFEGLLGRPAIQDELERKYIVLMDLYKEDLKKVQHIFISAKDQFDSLIDVMPGSMLPSVSRALYWTRGLRERIEGPMGYFHGVAKIVQEREEYKDIDKLYNNLLKMLKEFDDTKVSSWAIEVDTNSKSKLDQSLLKKCTDNRTIRVNFDPYLTNLMKEIKHLKVIGVEIPKTADEIYNKSKKYRDQSCSLSNIVGKYNKIETQLQEVERPLLEQRILKMEKTIHSGLEETKWTSTNVENFINVNSNITNEIDGLVDKMQSNINNIKEIMNAWKKPLFERKNKSMPMDDYMSIHSANASERKNLIKEKGKEIIKIIKEIGDYLKVEKNADLKEGKEKEKTPWKAYEDYSSNIIIEGLEASVLSSINELNKHLTPQSNRIEITPLFDVNIQLVEVGNTQVIEFYPPIGECSNKNQGVRNSILKMMNDYISVAQLFSRTDSIKQGDYMSDLLDDFDIKEGIASVYIQLTNIENETKMYLNQFNESFAFLWEDKVENKFKKFITIEEVNDADKVEDDVKTKVMTQTVFKDVVVKVPEIGKFEEQLSKLSTCLSKIKDMKTSVDKDWIRIECTNFKKKLEELCIEWIKKFAGFLLEQVKIKFKNLEKFISTISDGIKDPPTSSETPEEKKHLNKVMTHLRDMEYVKVGAINMIVPMKESIMAIRKNQTVSNLVTMEQDLLDKVEQMKTKIEETNDKAQAVKEKIIPLQSKEIINIKNELDKFNNEVVGFRDRFNTDLPFHLESSNADTIVQAYKSMQQYNGLLNEINKRAVEYNDKETLFNLQKTDYKQIKDCKFDLKNLKYVWDMIDLVDGMFNSWKVTTWDKIDSDQISTEINEITSKICNTSILRNKEIKGFRAFVALTSRVNNMKTLIPIIQNLRDKAMEQRHWKLLEKICGKPINNENNPNFCLDDLLKIEIYKFGEQVSEIQEQAKKEAAIKTKLDKIDKFWNDSKFVLSSYKETSQINQMDDVLETLGTHSMDLQGMLSQRYVEFFKDKVLKWQKNLRSVDSVIEIWLKVQKNWKKLESIFLGSDDIRASLPEDTKRFVGLDEDFRNLMKSVSENPNIVEACNFEGREGYLKGLQETIEKCEKSLNDYLEQKKKIFPRFYFVSNQALLDILSNANNPPKVMEYLTDMFDGLKKLEFQEQPGQGTGYPKTAIGMFSREKEHVKFSEKPFICEGNVENYLKSLEEKVKSELRLILEDAKATADTWDNNENPREEWLFKYPAQMVITACCIVWTEEVKRSFEEIEAGSDNSLKDQLKITIDRINKLIEKVRGELEPLDRIKIMTLITVDVHSRDIVDKFVIGKINDSQSFAWLSQFKFYWENDPLMKSDDRKKCLIRITDWQAEYWYEYIGNAGRLVITPLTDRCYITLSQALNLTMGGAPAGPAGTGKTETVKDMGHAIGLPVMVYNCSEQMNKDSMSQLFMGLSQSGAWGCFDEFNRISIEVLSVVSTQVKTCLDAVKKAKANKNPAIPNKFMFYEDEIIIIKSVGYFITMNPGYAGRTDLPENLKALFRSCAMVCPDFIPICENMLMSEGFQEAKDLSRKFITLYELSKELLSKQMHYDWGLRAIKSVLRMAGKLKRGDPDIKENPILMRALRDFNLPKIVSDDALIFRRLIDNLFPKVECEPKFDVNLYREAKKATTDKGYIDEEGFLKKVAQLAEILEVRHCCFIIGNAGCGKTTVWQTLNDTYTRLKEDSIFEAINPKAVSSSELFGSLSKTNEWKDGVLSVIMRDMTKENGIYKSTQLHKIIALDGDVDTEWIETMNSVMDDNKVLTLVSNERISLSPSMRLLFEITNLRNATPATVSRGGVLFINENDIGWKPFLETWFEEFKLLKKEDTKFDLKELTAAAYSHFYMNFDSHFGANFESFKASPLIVPMADITYVESTCKLIQSLWKQFLQTKRAAELCKSFREKDQEKKDDDLKMICEGIFFYAFIWAVGGVHTDSRNGFHNVLKNACKIAKLPDGGLCYDFFFDPEKSQWCPWSEIQAGYEQNPDTLFTNIVVPTIDTTRLSKIIEMNIGEGKPVLLCGTVGTGKTTIIKDFFRTMNKEKYKQCTINFNNYTDSIMLQKIMEGKIEKRTGKTLGPPFGIKMVYFMDDLNMPEQDKGGSQPPIDLIRHIVDYHQWYDRDHLDEKKLLVDVLFLGCMNPKIGSFYFDLRLQRHYTTISCSNPDEATLKYIYKNIMSKFLILFDPTLADVGNRCILASIALFKSISNCAQFIPTSKKYHYIFSIRDVGKIIQNIMNIQPGQYKGVPGKLAKLWYHETFRVYYDRIIFQEDQDEFKKQVNTILPSLENGINFDEVKKAPIIFTSFISQVTNSEKSYLPVIDMNVLKTTLQSKLESYNETFQNMNIVFFDQCMEHVARVARILDAPGGNAMLIGVGGTGKQSISKLSSYILEYDVMQIVMTSAFTINDLKENLQNLYRKATMPPGRSISFIMTDQQVPEEKFLVSINDILSSGYVPELFSKEDLDPIYSKLRNEAKQNGIPDDQVPDYFLNKSKKNIHIVLAFSPVGEKFRTRCRKFPALISCTSIDWFNDWPADALIDVARRFIDNVELSPEQKDGIALNMSKVHTSINEMNIKYLRQERRYNYTTPKSFLELIDFYKKLLGSKRDTLNDSTRRLEIGLGIILQTKTQVNGLKEKISVKLIEVEKATKETKEQQEKVNKEAESAGKEQDLANEEAKKADELAREADKLQDECNKELQNAIPALKKAEASVKELEKQKDKVNEYKDLKSPTEEVQNVAFAIMMLRKWPGKAEWPNAKKMMNPATKFLDDLKNFDGKSIEDAVLTKLKPYKEKSYFNFDDMKQKSVAAAHLCEWVNNIALFNEKYRIVKPLQDKADVAKAASTEAKAKLDAANGKAKEAADKVAVMKVKLAEAEAALDKIDKEFKALQQECDIANRLVNGLEGENKRWGENVVQLRIKKELLIGDSLLAAEFVSYIGAFSMNFRRQLWKDLWTPDIIEKKIPMSLELDPLYVLAKESDIAGWKNDGLPSDRVSYENAAVIISCSRWPLIIDPQIQGTKWIRGKEKENLVSMQLNQKGWLGKVTDSITNGKKLMIENLGNEIDPTLDPLLSRGFIKKGGRLLLKLGNEEVEFNKDFKLYLITKLFNPHYPPEIAAQCTIINFIVTESGLEDQLLSFVINLEKPDLETSKSLLVKQQNEFQVTLDKLETDLLNCLSDADPSRILQNTALIENLETTKKTALTIQEQSKVAQETEIKINISREIYRRVAAEGSMLYFLLIQLCIVNHMYQYSLESFVTFFQKAIESTENSSNEDERVISLREKIRITIYEWVARGLFERHKQIFYTQLTFRLMQKGILPQEPYRFEETQFLMKCIPKADSPPNPCKEWLPDVAWQSVMKMVELEEFKQFGENLASGGSRFKEWFNDLEPEKTLLPMDWKKLAGPGKYFLKLLVIRAMRPDRISPALSIFVRDALPNGNRFVELDLGKGFAQILGDAYENSNPQTPLFFILSPGSDPLQDVTRLGKSGANSFEAGKNFWNISMGQGMEKEAERRLDQAHKEGHWVMLENIHLMPKWLKQLEKKLDDFALETSNGKFRLFLSAEPSRDIPIGILERCIKLTNEPPQGMKMNMLRAFTFFGKDGIDNADPKIRTVLFALCFFHAVVIERKRFGPIGWNCIYPFNMNDLRDSSIVLNNYIERDQGGANKLPWDDLRYIFGEIMYGGHITDELDRRLCRSYLEYMMRQELLEEADLVPFADPKSGVSLKCPQNLSYEAYLKHIDDSIKMESPMLYGLHPNAEIGYRTQNCKELFASLQDLQPKDSAAGTEDINTLKADKFREIKQKIESDIGDTKLDVEGIKSSLSDEERGPYQNVFLLECEYMNALTQEITKSVIELELAFSGQLSMTDRLEKLVDWIYFDKVPATWAKIAYPSERGLVSWIDNLKARVMQLNEWKDNPTYIPRVVYLNRLFNPQSFLTAIKQVYSKNKNEELNKLYIQTEITKKNNYADVELPTSKATESAYVYGLQLEGARWDPNSNCMEESAPKKLFSPLPVTLCKAERMPPEGKEDRTIYQCPVYKTAGRGSTYVFTAQIKIKTPAMKWVMAGVAIILDVEGDANLPGKDAPAAAPVKQ